MAASPLSPLSAQILPIRNQNDEDGSLSSSSNDSSFCPPFANDEALDAYVSSIDVMFDGNVLLFCFYATELSLSHPCLAGTNVRTLACLNSPATRTNLPHNSRTTPRPRTMQRRTYLRTLFPRNMVLHGTQSISRHKFVVGRHKHRKARA